MTQSKAKDQMRSAPTQDVAQLEKTFRTTPFGRRRCYPCFRRVVGAMAALSSVSSWDWRGRGRDRVSCAGERFPSDDRRLPATGVAVLPGLFMTAATEPGDPGRYFPRRRRALPRLAGARARPRAKSARSSSRSIKPQRLSNSAAEKEKPMRSYPRDALLVLRMAPVAA